MQMQRPPNTIGGAGSCTAGDDNSDTNRASQRLLVCAGWVALLFAEGFVLSEVYDSISFLGDTRWWAMLLAYGPRLLGRLIVAAVVATLLLGGRPLREALWQGSSQRRHYRSWPFVFAHLVAFAGFTVLTTMIARGWLKAVVYPGGCVLAWAAMGAIALSTWAMVVLPRGFMHVVGRRGAARLLAVLAVAIAAVGVGHTCERVLWAPRAGTALTSATFWAASGLVGLFFSDPVCRPDRAILGVRGFTVNVSPQCSGYEGMGLILVFLAAFLGLFRRSYRFPHALLLLPLGVAAMWLANVARIALLITVGTLISPAVAVQGFHSQAGWLAFNGIALGLVLASRRIRFFTQPDPGAGEFESTNPTAAYLVPLLTLIAATMFTGAFSSGFDKFYPFRVLATAAALWYFRRYYAALRWIWSWTAVAIGVGTFVLWMALEPASAGTAAVTSLGTDVTSLGAPWSTAWLVFRVVGSVVTVPLAEELAFRGYVTRRLIATEFQAVPLGRFTWFSFLVSSALFGALHGRWLAGILAGMLFAVALYRRGELSDAILAHATTNALVAAYVLATGSWSLWA
jgi:exosortase E/protease (VPEID-CTERM system)